MNRRMLLLFALFLVSSLFYALVAHQAAPQLVQAERSKLEALNHIDQPDSAGRQGAPREGSH